MKQFLAIFKKELFSYANSLAGYIVIAVFLALSSFIFFRTFFLAGQASMRAYFALLPWMLLFVTSAVSMRMWAEESKQGTIELLHTWPLKEWQIVAGKLMAAWAYIASIFLLTVTIPISIAQFGNPDGGVIFAGYVGALLLAGAFLAVGSWISSFTDNQIVAFMVSLALNFVFLMIGEQFMSSFFPEAFRGILNYLGFYSHISSIARGVIDTRDIIYYLSVILLFSVMTMLRVKKRA